MSHLYLIHTHRRLLQDVLMLDVEIGAADTQQAALVMAQLTSDKINLQMDKVSDSLYLSHSLSS